jgi:hypothetical protein
MSKTLKRKKLKHAKIDKIEAMALRGEDTSPYFGTPKKMPPREVRKMKNLEHIIKVNVDLTESFLSELDEIALFLNVSRQAVMKSLLKDGIDRHFIAKHARKTG